MKFLNLILQNGTSSETIEHLKLGKGDLGFVNLPIDDKDVNLSNTVMQLHDVFVASEKFSELFSGTVDLRRLQDYPLLMLDLSSSTRQAIVNFAHSQGIHLHPEIELTSLELMISLAENGMGIACVPREFVKKQLEEKTLFEIKTNPILPSRAIGLVLPKQETITFAVKEFLKLINQKEI